MTIFKTKPHKNFGFSLLELIAVMAIMAILAGTLAPNVFDAIKRAKSDAESHNIVELIKSLKNSIINRKYIPTSSTNSWVTAISTTSSFNNNEIEFNDFGFRRRIVFDPLFFTNSNSTFPGLTQNQGLASAPVSPRLMLISDLTRNVPSITNTSTIFNNIWEQNNGANIVESNDVKIERLNLSDSFHRIILSNESIQQPSYQLEDGSIISIPAASGGVDGSLTRFVLDKTRISLIEPSLLGAGTEQMVNVIASDWTSRYQTNGTNYYWGRP